MTDLPETPEESDEAVSAQLASQVVDAPTPLRELAINTHELYDELKDVGFPQRALNEIIALMLSDVVTGRVFEYSIEIEEDDGDIDEGDFFNDHGESE